jgi:hypothetical protein
MLKKKMVDGKLWYVNGDKKIIEFPQSEKYINWMFNNRYRLARNWMVDPRSFEPENPVAKVGLLKREWDFKNDEMRKIGQEYEKKRIEKYNKKKEEAEKKNPELFMHNWLKKHRPWEIEKAERDDREIEKMKKEHAVLRKKLGPKKFQQYLDDKRAEGLWIKEYTPEENRRAAA